MDEVGLPQLWEHQFPRLLGEGDFRVWEPGPVVRVSPPGVRVLEGKCQAVVDGGDIYQGRRGGRRRRPARGRRDRVLEVRRRRRGRGRRRFLSGGLLVPDEPVVVAPVSIPDDVVQDDQVLEADSELGLEFRRRRLRLEPPQVVLGVLVTFHKGLQRTDLETSRCAVKVSRTGHAAAAKLEVPKKLPRGFQGCHAGR